MKTMKKMLTLVLALLMVVSLALPAMASDVQEPVAEPIATPEYKITIMSSKSNTVAESGAGHTYEAYQILSGTMKADSEDPTRINFSVEGWGTGVNADALLAALKAADFGEGVTNPFTGVTTAQEFAAVLEKASADQATLVAEYVSQHLSTTCEIADYVRYDESSKKYVYEVMVDVGYYLIKDQTDSLEGEANKDYTSPILHVANNLTVYHKGSIPTVDKSVSEYNNTYKDSIETAMNQEYFYKLVATLPSDFDSYESYLLRFKDNMSDGIDFVGIERAYAVRTDDGAEVTLHQQSEEHPHGYVLDATGKPIIIEFTDLKHEGNEHKLEGGDQIVIIYKAKLNENAIIGAEGNENSVSLDFSNNPLVEDDYGTTTDDITTVYTFGVGITKIDGQTGETLEGVEFVLWHQVTVDGNLVPAYAVMDKEEKDGVVTYKITGWTTNEDDATPLVSLKDAKFNIAGLNTKVNYYLKETKALDGYNPLTADVKIYLSAEYDAEGNVTYVQMPNDPNANIDGNWTTDILDAEGKDIGDNVHGVDFKVINNPGTVLPETGGMGTTIFYVLGAVMALGAALLLITKKRVAA